MLALACQRGHLAVVKLLVLTHGADPESYAVRKNEFPVIVRLPLYAAIKSGGSPVSPHCPPQPRRMIAPLKCGTSRLPNHWCGGFCNSQFFASFSKGLHPSSSCPACPYKGISVAMASGPDLGGTPREKVPRKFSSRNLKRPGSRWRSSTSTRTLVVCISSESLCPFGQL